MICCVAPPGMCPIGQRGSSTCPIGQRGSSTCHIGQRGTWYVSCRSKG